MARPGFAPDGLYFPDRRVLVLEAGPAHWSSLIRMPLGEVFTVAGVHDLHRGQGGTRSRARAGLA